MRVVGDILIVDELKDNHNHEFGNYNCVVTDVTQGILELMPMTLFEDIYMETYDENNNQLFYLIDDETKYNKVGRIDKAVMSDLFVKMNQLKGDHVFEYVMPK